MTAPAEATPPVAGGVRVFDDPTTAGLALAVGARFSSLSDTGRRVQITLTDVPENFDEQHRAGVYQVSTRDAAYYVDHVVKMIRSQCRLRERAQANRQAWALPVEKKTL